MTNPDPSMSCCSNQPAFGSTLLCVSGEWGGAWLAGWGCVCVCEEGGLGYWAVCMCVWRGWGGWTACVLKHD